MLSLSQPVHFIGIAGAGMSALAEVLLHYKVPVSGSDANASPVLERLQTSGATVFVGHLPNQIPQGALVVYSTAVKPNNPERQAATQQGLLCWHRSQLLQAILEGGFPGFSKTVGLSGTHGKTTLTGMVGLLLEQTGFDPTVIAGGPLPNQARGRSNHFSSNVRLGESPTIAVAELDESDGTITSYRPTVSVVSNLELDHADHYTEGETEFLDTFATFFKQLSEPTASGEARTLILNANCNNSYGLGRDISRYMPADKVKQWWLWDPASSQHTSILPLSQHASVFKLHGIEPLKEQDGYKAELWQGRERLAAFQTSVPGLHNVWNGAQAFLAAYACGADPAKLAEALPRFTGMGRRFERLGRWQHSLLVDDYAHHPTEIEATLQAARIVQGHWQNQFKATKKGAFPVQGRLIAIFQPHRYSRFKAFWEGFAESLEAADLVYVLPVYSAGEDAIGGVSQDAFVSRMVQRRKVKVQALSDDWHKVQSLLEKVLLPGDLVITLGAGNVTQLLRTLPGRTTEPLALTGGAV